MYSGRFRASVRKMFSCRSPSDGGNGASVIDRTIGAIRAERGNDQFEDDVSIVEVAF